MMRQLKRAYRVRIWQWLTGRTTSVDAVTEGAALELVEQINKSGLETAQYVGVVGARKTAVDAPRSAPLAPHAQFDGKRSNKRPATRSKPFISPVSSYLSAISLLRRHGR
jgi:hypothetical protein